VKMAVDKFHLEVSEVLLVIQNGFWYVMVGWNWSPWSAIKVL